MSIYLKETLAQLTNYEINSKHNSDGQFFVLEFLKTTELKLFLSQV